jgi:hypothetical protein
VSFKEILETVLLVLKVLFWLVMLATAVTSFFFVKDSSDVMRERIAAGEPPFSLGGIVGSESSAQDGLGSEEVESGGSGSSSPRQS